MKVCEYSSEIDLYGPIRIEKFKKDKDPGEIKKFLEETMVKELYLSNQDNKICTKPFIFGSDKRGKVFAKEYI